MCLRLHTCVSLYAFRLSTSANAVIDVATLLLGDSQRKHDLTRAGALPAVVKLLKGDDLALLSTALQLLQGFSDAPENRPVLFDCGVMTGLESVRPDVCVLCVRREPSCVCLRL